jgi:ATP-dependent Lon protease
MNNSDDMSKGTHAASDKDPDRYIVPTVSMRRTVIFPILNFPIPLTITQSRTLEIVAHAKSKDSLVFIAAQVDPEDEHPSISDLYQVGILARVIDVRREDDADIVVIEGQSRARVTKAVDDSSLLLAEVEVIHDSEDSGVELSALMQNLKELAVQVVKLTPRLPDEVVEVFEHIDDPAQLIDLIATQTSASVLQKQEILELVSVKERARSAMKLLSYERSLLEIIKEIRTEVKDSLDQHQKEVFLREQMKAIQKQLGDDEEEADELKDRIEAAQMPDVVEETALKELKRLGRMNPQSSEFTVSRNYIDWLLDIPWSQTTEDQIDLTQAAEVLDAHHHGLEKVKRRIIEFLAVCKLKGAVKGPILCLVGPPGVGKTSLGKSVADAIGRKFTQISLGGVRDEAEIRGHRRTYIGSLPGRFVKALKKAESMNPVVCLDEIDKLGSDFRGDPGSALLEVLDPEQNHNFSDHYLEVPLDLSKVLFFTTANRLDTIPPALRDRLEIIELPGYIQEEKLAIAREHLLPVTLDEHGLSAESIIIDDDNLNMIIEQYTREAGVRTLKRQLAGVFRSVAHDLATEKLTAPVQIDASRIRSALGPQKVFPESAEKIDIPGLAVGLAWTPVGGEILFIEATLMKGSGKLTLTGQLGEVMKESAHTAMSFIHSRAEMLNLDETLFSERNIHLHLPSGAIPKDGPSAGVALTVALTSLFLNQPMNDGIAMTGEITLRGRVLPVGGIKEKVIAAARADMKTIILPKRNEGDLEEIPSNLKEKINFHLVETIDEVYEIALGIPK